jgi:hypothetical protein
LPPRPPHCSHSRSCPPLPASAEAPRRAAGGGGTARVGVLLISEGHGHAARVGTRGRHRRSPALATNKQRSGAAASQRRLLIAGPLRARLLYILRGARTLVASRRGIRHMNDEQRPSSLTRASAAGQRARGPASSTSQGCSRRNSVRRAQQYQPAAETAAWVRRATPLPHVPPPLRSRIAHVDAHNHQLVQRAEQPVLRAAKTIVNS